MFELERNGVTRRVFRPRGNNIRLQKELLKVAPKMTATAVAIGDLREGLREEMASRGIPDNFDRLEKEVIARIIAPVTVSF